MLSFFFVHVHYMKVKVVPIPNTDRRRASHGVCALIDLIFQVKGRRGKS